VNHRAHSTIRRRSMSSRRRLTGAQPPWYELHRVYAPLVPLLLSSTSVVRRRIERMTIP